MGWGWDGMDGGMGWDWTGMEWDGMDDGMGWMMGWDGMGWNLPQYKNFGCFTKFFN